MHAFGVGVHYDQTGTFIDSGTATWALLTSPNSTFSAAAAQAMSNLNFSPYSGASVGDSSKQVLRVDGDQEILNPVPEPSTVALWSLGLTGALLRRRRKLRHAA
jgi:hypothetical protein